MSAPVDSTKASDGWITGSNLLPFLFGFLFHRIVKDLHRSGTIAPTWSWWQVGLAELAGLAVLVAITQGLTAWQARTTDARELDQ